MRGSSAHLPNEILIRSKDSQIIDVGKTRADGVSAYSDPSA